MAEPQPQNETVQELVGLSVNLKTANTLLDLVDGIQVPGSKVQDIAQAVSFLQGLKGATEARMQELQSKLPKQNPVAVAPQVEVGKGDLGEAK